LLRKTWLKLSVSFAIGSAIAPILLPPPQNSESISTLAAAPLTSAEQPVTLIPLAGPLADRNSEVSGLAWYGESLVMLPQYPQRLSDSLFVLSKSEILSFLNGQTAGPLVPRPVAFDDGNIGETIAGFEGYEAIAFVGNQAFLTIEAETANGAMGYLVKGQLDPELSQLTLDITQQATIAPQSNSENKSEETLLIKDNQPVTVYEVNGAQVNASPVAHVFSSNLLPQPTVPFPAIEYRITDATELDARDRFWAINYFYPGDTDLLPNRDPLAIRYGRGETHRQHSAVERLVEFEYGQDQITLTQTAPIQLKIGAEGRNWEGIARLDTQGFLLMTDKFPETILGYVAMP